MIFAGYRAEDVLAVARESPELAAWLEDPQAHAVVSVGPPSPTAWGDAMRAAGPGAELRCVVALSSLLIVAQLAGDVASACPACILYWLATAGEHVRAIQTPRWTGTIAKHVELAELSSSRFVAVDARTGRSTGHDVPFRHPACDCHGPDDTEQLSSVAAAGAGPPAVGASTGLIARTEVTMFPSEDDVAVAVATSWVRNTLLPLRPDDARPLLTTFGVSFDAVTARLTAEWEAVERAAIAVPKAGGSPRTAASMELDSEAHIDPRHFGLKGANPDQTVALREPGRFERYRWLDARDPEGQLIAIPEWSVFPSKEAPPIIAVTSNGVAAHPDRVQADERAALEALERDAVLRAWFRRERLSHYRTAQLDRVSELVKMLKERGYSVWVVRCGAHLPCSVAMAVIAGSETLWPGVCTGSAARWSDAAAVEHALLEAVGSLAIALSSSVEGPSSPIPDIATPAHHALWYRRRGSIPAVEHLITPDRLVDPSFAAAEPSLAALIPHLAGGEPRSVAFYDYGDPVSDAYRTHVVRCVAPALLYLSFGQRSVRADRSRGCASAMPDSPHPFT